jgi:hypothetical protein
MGLVSSYRFISYTTDQLTYYFPIQQCPAECGRTAIQTRVMQCLWKGTFDEAPKEECDALVRPSVTQICHPDSDSCEDNEGEEILLNVLSE